MVRRDEVEDVEGGWPECPGAPQTKDTIHFTQARWSVTRYSKDIQRTGWSYSTGIAGACGRHLVTLTGWLCARVEQEDAIAPWSFTNEPPSRFCLADSINHSEDALARSIYKHNAVLKKKTLESDRQT
jgi:hypothetical protein